MSVNNVNSKRSLLENIDKIEKTDKLSDFVDKCNDNFTAIVKNGGGPKGDRGVKGDQGNPTKPKVPIHVWKKGVDYISETQTKTGTQTIFNIEIDQDKLSDVKYQENHLILLENAHVYKLVLDKFTLKPEFVFELLYFNPDDIKKRNLHIACADSYDASNNKYVGFKVMTNTLYPIQKPYVGICIDDNEDSPDEQLSYNWIYIGGSGSGPSNPGSGPSNPGSGPSNPGSGPSNPGSGKCIYVTLSNDNGNFIYSDINSDLPISGPVSTIARLEIDGEPVNKGVTWSCTPTDNVVLPQENYKGEDYTESGYIGRKFEVTGMSGNEMSGSLKITATYGDNIYPKVFSLRKYINESTYDINPTITTLTLLDTSSKPIDIYFQIKETTTNNKHIYYPRNDQDRIFGDSKVLNLFIELIRDTELVQLEDELIPDIVKSSNNDSVYYYKLTIDDIDDISTLKSYNTLRININKNNSDFNEFEDIAIVSLESSLDLDISAGYLSTVFTRSATKPAIPKGGNWDNPVPTDPKGEVTWYDGIIPGIEQLYESHATISSDGTKPVWSEPDPMTDSFNAKYIFSTEESPVGPRPNNPDKDKGPKFNEKYWTDDVTDSENTLWKAESYFTNGVWGPWQVCKIKGEKGNDGTSISIKGSGRAVDNLSDANENDKVLLLKTHKENGATIPWIYLWNKDANDGSGDWVKYDGNEGEAYVIDGYLYVWDGDTWVNCGRFKGDAGVSQFVHIKYANEDPNGTKIKYQGKNIYISFTDSNNDGDTIDDNDGETPGSYVGIRVDENVNDSNNIKDYEWHKWNGEDGWGYDYIYCLTNTFNAPTVPYYKGPYVPYDPNFTVKEYDSVDEKYHTWIWTDDPQEVTETNRYCWVCYSQFMNGAWTYYKGKGNSNGKSKGVLWSKWSKDGIDGTSIILDLDNQHDSLIYDDKGNCVSDPVITTAKLYVNGVSKRANFKASCVNCTFDPYESSSGITSDGGTNNTQGIVGIKNLDKYDDKGNILHTYPSGYVDITATYNNKTYTKRFNIKKLINQCKYQIITKPTAISYNDDVKSASVNIKIRKTDGKGESSILTSQSELNKDNLSLISDIGSISDYGEEGATLTLDSLNDITNVNIELKENKGTDKKPNYFVHDSEDIPVFKGGTGPEGPGGSSVRTLYKASHEKPTQLPYINTNGNLELNSWTDDLSKIQYNDDVEISHGGLWNYLGDGTYRSVVGTAMGLGNEERFFIKNKNSNDVNIPIHIKVNGETLGCLAGKEEEDSSNINYVDIVPTYMRLNNNSATVNYPEDCIFISGTSNNNSHECNISVNNGNHFITCVHIDQPGIDTDGNNTPDSVDPNGYVEVSFGAYIWKCEYRVDEDDKPIKDTMSNPIRTTEKNIRIITPPTNTIGKNLLYGARLQPYRRGSWITSGANIKNYTNDNNTSENGQLKEYANGEYESSFNGNYCYKQNLVSIVNNKYKNYIVLDYILYDRGNQNNTIVESNKDYTFSYRGRGTGFLVVLIKEDSNGERVQYICDIDRGSSEQTFIYYKTQFKTPDFSIFDSNKLILRVIYSNFYTTDDGVYYKRSPGYFLMPKLELGTKATEFTVNDLDIGSKRNAPIRINTWAENTVYSSGERDSDKYTDIVIYGGNYYRCLINHTSIKDNPPISTDGIVSKYWEAATDYNFIATKILLAERAYIKNLVAECIRTAPEMDNNNNWQSRFVAEGNEIAFYGTKKYPAMRMSVDDGGDGYLAFIDQDNGQTEYILNAKGLKKYSEGQLREYIEENNKYRILKDDNKNNITTLDSSIITKVFERKLFTTLYVYHAPSNGDLMTLATDIKCNNILYEFKATLNHKYTTSNGLTAYAVIASEQETSVMYAEDICGIIKPEYTPNNAMVMKPVDYTDNSKLYNESINTINWEVKIHPNGKHVYKTPIYYKTLYKFDNGVITQVPIRIYKQNKNIGV